MADFKKRIYSGTCMCGHSYEDHHLGMVLNPEALAVMGPHLPQECAFFGTNEDAGLDENGEDHCSQYVDAEDPDPDILAEGLCAVGRREILLRADPVAAREGSVRQ